MNFTIPPRTWLDNLCEESGCDAFKENGSEYCEKHHAHHYCDCGHSLGEYAGEGLCKGCQ